MECNFFQLYFLTGKEKYFFGLSPEPLVDFQYFQAQGYEKMTVLTPPLPLAVAELLLKTTGGKKNTNWWKRFLKPVPFMKKPETILEKALNSLQKQLAKLPVEITLSPQEFRAEQKKSMDLDENLQKIQTVLQGRILFSSEIEWVLKEKGISGNAQALAHGLCLTGKASWQRGVSPDGQCQRCGNRALENKKCWWSKGLECFYCPECAAMGQCRLCSVLYSFPPVVGKERMEVSLDLNFSLTPAQAEASGKLEEFLEAKEQKCLLWAVCGAGKTEIVYGAIRKALAKGEKVLLAIPRQEVVRELLPRLQDAFPNVKVIGLYGRSREKYSSGQLVVATTHQALRFYQNFSLVVLDEVDAYPYRGNAMLQYGIKRAGRGKTIYLTATPEEEMLKLPTITIPARHHGFPLPEPKLLALTHPSLQEIQEQGLPKTILDYLEESVEKDSCQVFIFLPSIKLTVAVGEWLKEYYQREKRVDWVEYSHSQDPEREKKKDRFTQGDFPFLVTTTIMERGVTIPRLNVLVLYSDQERIFNTQALIQMAGRVGRKKEYPWGRVLLAGSRISHAMQQAQEMIKKMNQEAKAKGYLKPFS